MNTSGSARTLSKLWLLTIGVLAIAVLYLAKVLFLPLAFAVLFAFLLAPVVSWLERLRMPRALAGAVVLACAVAILGCAGWVVFSQLVDVTNDLPTYEDNISEKIAAMHTPTDSPLGRAQREMQRLNEQLGLDGTPPPAVTSDGHPGTKNAKKPLGTTPDHPVQVREVDKPTGRLDQLGGVLEPLTTAGLTIVFTFFVLLQREDLRNRVIRLTGDRNLTRMTQAMHDASRRITRYFSLQLLVNVVYGALVSTALYFIGLPHAVLFGVVAGLLRFVPYIGAPVAAALPVVLSLAVFHGWTESLLILATFFVLEIVTGNYIEPRVYGKHTGLSSLAILVAAAFWTLIWGPVGLILSVPLTVCLVVMGRHVPSLEFLTVMLGDQPAIPPWTSFYQRLLARDEREASEIVERCLKDAKLDDVYDAVLVPALILSEEDRLHGDLEDGTIRFIRRTARELIDEFGFRDSTVPEGGPGPAAGGLGGAEPNATETPVRTVRVMCVPVRDEVDELGATMLAQVLDGEGVKAVAAPVERLDAVISAVAEEKPDVVFLCGLPPIGMSRSHRLYRSLRVRNAKLRIMVGLWGYADDVNEAAQRITGGEEARVMTRLTEAATEVRAFLGVEPAPAAEAAAVEAAGKLPDRSAA